MFEETHMRFLEMESQMIKLVEHIEKQLASMQGQHTQQSGRSSRAEQKRNEEERRSL